MQKIGLIVAMRREAQPLLRRVGSHSRGRIAALTVRQFTLAGVRCSLVECGIGLPRAASMTAAFLAAESPGLLVSFGVAGGGAKGLEVGDVVAVENVVLMEERDTVPPLAVSRPLSLMRLSSTAFDAVERAVGSRGAAFHRGTAVTTRGASLPAEQVAGMSHPVLDMETYGIAREAARQGIPLLALRALSDSVREPLPFDLGALTDSAYHFHPLRLIAYLARRPRSVPGLFRLQRNARRAAENAAIAVLAAVAALQERGT